MPLSEDEQRILQQIEAQLYESDPALAREVATTTLYSHAFRNIKLEVGAQATPWRAAPPDIEEQRCRRFFQRLATTGGAPGILGYVAQRVSLNIIDAVCILPVPMRADPTLLTSGFAWVNAPPVGNQAGFFSNSSAVWSALTGASGASESSA